MPDLSKRLSDGLVNLGFDLPSEQHDRLLAFVELLRKWNKVFNLTALNDPAEILTLHILDSLAVGPHLKGSLILDVGSGAGLPGIPLAIAFPDKSFTLLDSNGKKTRFITQAYAQLGLQNVAVVNDRCENYHPDFSFDTVMARAFAPVPRALTLLSHLISPNGRLLMMKSKQLAEEVEQIPVDYVKTIIQLNVPDLRAERNLLVLEKHSSATSHKE